MGTLESSLSLAVPMHIMQLHDMGGPSSEDFSESSKFSSVLAQKGDILMYGGGKEGEVADLFNKTAKAIAILSFLPGGVELFGSKWESENFRKK